MICWGNEEQSIGIFKFASATPRNEIIGRHERGDVMSVVFSPGGRWMASGGQDGRILLWNYKQSQLMDVFELRLNCRGMMIDRCRGLEEAVEVRSTWNQGGSQYEERTLTLRELLLARGAIEAES